jgi:hypothetical protein
MGILSSDEIAVRTSGGRERRARARCCTIGYRCPGAPRPPFAGNTTAATSELLRTKMLQLYLYYIEDHIDRLGSIGKTELASAFHEWRERLVR